MTPVVYLWGSDLLGDVAVRYGDYGCARGVR